MTDDGVRLWVNGQELVNSWVLQAPTEHSGAIALSANRKYPILMEYFEHTGGAMAQLSWSSAGGGVYKEIVPMSQLYPGTTLPQPTLSYSQTGSQLTFTWPVGSYNLYWSTNVTGLYTNLVYSGPSPAVIPLGIGPEPSRYYRLLSY